METNMSSKTLMLAGALVSAALLAPLPSQANAMAPAKVPPQSVVAADSLVQQVRRGGPRCWYWRNECAARWGWGNWRFRRCLSRHGCW
jgi:hypothetical protein